MHPDLVELLRCPLTAAPLRLDAHDGDRHRVGWGILRGPTCDYPIVDGIAVLRGGDQEAIGRLRRGDREGALATALARDVPSSRWHDVTEALGSLRPTRPIAARLEGSSGRRAIARMATAVDGSGSDPDPLLRAAMVDTRHPNPEGYRYFRYRLGLPRHLVALGCLTAAEPGDGPILEIGAGAGHLTWQIADLHAPRPVVAVERELYLLWVARHFTAPDATLVCGDARALPLASGSCSLAVAVDVLSFVTEKASAVRELERVVAPGGGLVLTSLINARARHEFAGEPLDPGAWAGLVGATDRIVYDDDDLLDRYLGGEGPPAVGDAARSPGSRTISVLAGPAALSGTGRRFAEWPHGRGRLGPHPLLAPNGTRGGSAPDEGGVTHLRRVTPSPGFARDNAGVTHYLPARVDVPRAVVDDARAGRRTAAVEALLARAVLLGYPPTYAPDPWGQIIPSGG